MFFGQVLMGTQDSVNYFTPWFPRQGNKAKIVVDLINRSSSGSVTVYVETKKENESDKEASSLANSTVNTVGQDDFYAGADLDDTTNPGFEDLVRFRVTVGGGDGEWVHVRILNPAWLSN